MPSREKNALAIFLMFAFNLMIMDGEKYYPRDFFHFEPIIKKIGEYYYRHNKL
jgi:hypothetical protein